MHERRFFAAPSLGPGASGFGFERDGQNLCARAAKSDAAAMTLRSFKLVFNVANGAGAAL